MSEPAGQFYLDQNSPIRGRFKNVALVTGVVGLALSAVGYFVDSQQFFYSYLVAFAFWLTLAMGGLFFVMLHHLTGATWSVVIRRQAESIASVIPYMAILIIPILFGIRELYPWSRPEIVATDHVIHHKSAYLNVPFFIGRVVVFFGIWIALSLTLLKTSLSQDEGHTSSIGHRMRKISAPGMVLFALSFTFAGFDWFMSQDSHWYSTIFGVYIFAGGLLSVLAFLTFISLALRRRQILSETITREHYHDLGKLTFAFLVFWSYIAFSQYLLIWYANIPEETVWFASRYKGSWRYFALLLVYGYFVIPFILLIFRGTKRRLHFMRWMALWLLFMHWIDLYWIIVPNLKKQNAWPGWIDLAAMIGIGGIFLWLFWRQYFSGALVPVKDPRLKSSIEFVNY